MVRKAPLGHKAYRVSLARRAFRASKGRREQTVLVVQLAPRGPRAHKVCKDSWVLADYRARSVVTVSRVPSDHEASRARSVRKVDKELPALRGIAAQLAHRALRA